jgi:pimeloyl-ACP methyl ester carboxylesterase
VVQRHSSDESAKKQSRVRGCLFWIGGTTAGAILVTGVLLVAGYLYESSAEASDVRAYPPPGQLNDVGGYRLHLYCTGSGSPTVVIDAGWGDSSVNWSWVQPEVAKTTRVCTYDRGGLGWSDPGPMPRDARHLAGELRALLQKGGVPGPYVLAGHSMGGLVVRVFSGAYPNEVAGMVLIDSMSPDQFHRSGSPPTAPDSDPRPESFPAIVARFGLARLLTGRLNLPEEAAGAQVAFSVTPQFVQAYVNEGQDLPASAEQARAVTTLGGKPLTVVSRAPGQDKQWDGMQAELLALSPNSQQVFADKSGHNIELEQPEAAIDAIVRMVERIQRG